MGDRGRQLPHGGDPIGVGELRLRLAVSSLALAQIFLRPLALGNVLDGAEHAPRLAQLVPHHITPTVQDAHLAVGSDHAILHVVPRAATERFRYCPDYNRLILRMDQSWQHGIGYLALLWRQPKDAVGFV